MSASVNCRTEKPPAGSASRRPSWARRLSACRTGVLEAPRRAARASSVRRCPAAKSPRRSISRNASTARSVCDAASLAPFAVRPAEVAKAAHGSRSRIQSTSEKASRRARWGPAEGFLYTRPRQSFVRQNISPRRRRVPDRVSELQELRKSIKLQAVGPSATPRAAFHEAEREGGRQRRLTASAGRVESGPHTRDEGRRWGRSSAVLAALLGPGKGGGRAPGMFWEHRGSPHRRTCICGNERCWGPC